MISVGFRLMVALAAPAAPNYTVSDLPITSPAPAYAALAAPECTAPTAMQQELPCWREWLSVAYQGLQSSLAMGGTVALIETCGISLGTTCVAAAWGVAQSGEEFDDFVGALGRLRTCLNGAN